MMRRSKWWLLLAVSFWFYALAYGEAKFHHHFVPTLICALTGAICTVKAIKELSRSFSS